MALDTDPSVLFHWEIFLPLVLLSFYFLVGWAFMILGTRSMKASDLSKLERNAWRWITSILVILVWPLVLLRLLTKPRK